MKKKSILLNTGASLVCGQFLVTGESLLRDNLSRSVARRQLLFTQGVATGDDLQTMGQPGV